MIIIETARLIIRKITQHDFMDLYAICSNPELMRFVGNGNPLSKDQTLNWLHVTLNNYDVKGFGMYAVIEKETNAFIGYCGLVYTADVADNELIYALNKAFWGRGLATEIEQELVSFGFSSLGLKNIYASIDPDNKASKGVLLKAGFREVFKKNDENGLETAYFLRKIAH